LHHENLLRLLVAGQLFFAGARGKRLADGIGLTPHLNPKEAGPVPLEDKLAALSDAARFLADSEDDQEALAFLSEDDGSAFLVHLHRVVAGRAEICRLLRIQTVR
jgi:hypothetical protein